MPPIPEISVQNETEEQIADRLEELEKLLQEAEKLRRRQFLISGCTILLMLVILSFFIIGMLTFFKTYPKRLLMQEVLAQNRLILSDPYYFGANRRYDRKLVQHFLSEMHRELQRRKPFLRQELRTVIRSLNAYASTELRKDFQARLYKQLTAETRLYLKEKNLDPDAGLQLQLQKMNVELAAAVTDAVFGDPETADRESFKLFQSETAHLRQTELYGELSCESMDVVEQRMLENLMECVVCRLNDWKNANGGPDRE